MAENETQGERALPDGWVWATVEEIAERVNSGFPSGKHNTDGRGVPHLRPMNISPNGDIDLSLVKYVEVSNYDALRQGDVLFNNTNSPTWLGKTTYIRKNTNWAYSNHMTRIRLHPRFDSGWVAYALHHLFLTGFFRMNCRHHVNQASINMKFLSTQTSIPIPPSAEQRRIVAETETQFTRLDAAVAALERAQANLRRYKAAVLKAACEGRLVPTETSLACAEGRDYEPAGQLLARILAERRARWEAEHPGKRYKKPVPQDMEGLPELQEGWVWASLPQLGELNRGKSKHRPRNDERLLGGPYPFIQTGEIRQAEGAITTYSQTYSEFGLAQSRLWPKGTLCITIAANIAETAILGFDGCFPDSVVGFMPEDGVDVCFVEYFVRTAKEDLERYAPATAQKNINLRTLRGVAVPLPPLAEQHRIVAEVERRLSVVAALEASVSAALARARRLRQAVLKQAFEGRLVTQDPDDEPAAVLLERIRAEKAQREGKGKDSRKKQRKRNS